MPDREKLKLLDEKPVKDSYLDPDACAVVAATWAFAEATMFFIVPDVLLTAIGIRSLRRAVKAALWAVAGALLGGLLMHTWGSVNPTGARAVLDQIPAISPGLISAVSSSLGEHGAAALFLGPLTGTPYKIYAVEAGNGGMPLWLFLLVSIPARLIRFAALAAVSGIFSLLAAKQLSPQARYLVLAIIWIAFYAVYFYRM